MGLDMGDLEEYGFDSRGACGGVCSPFVFDSYEDYLVKARLFTDRLFSQVSKQFELSSCHPYVKENVPRVQYVWELFPLNYLLGPWRWLLDCVAFPLLFWVWILWLPFITLPWNLVAYSFWCPTICSLVCTFPCVFCLAACI